MNDEVKGSPRVELERARNILASIWFVGAGLLFLIVMLQTMFGKYVDSAEQSFAQEIWSWFTPTVFPTLGLMLGVIAATAFEEDDEKRNVKRFFFRIALTVSAVYLAILLLTLTIGPLAGVEDDRKFYKMSNYWLAPLQGLVAAAIGAVFNSRKRTQPGAGAS